MSYRGIEPPEGVVDLFRYRNGGFVIRHKRSDGVTPPWHSIRTHTHVENNARAILARWLKKNKIEGVDPMAVPVKSSPPSVTPWGGGKTNLPAVVPKSSLDENMTEGEKRAYKNGYAAAAYHVKKKLNGGVPALPTQTGNLSDLVAVLAANLNAAAVALRLLQERAGVPTSE